MFPTNDYLWQKEFELNRQPEVLARVEQRRLLKEAGLDRRPWLSCQICHSLWHLGHVLVTAGQRLERRYAHAERPGPAVLRPAA